MDRPVRYPLVGSQSGKEGQSVITFLIPVFVFVFECQWNRFVCCQKPNLEHRLYFYLSHFKKKVYATCKKSINALSKDWGPFCSVCLWDCRVVCMKSLLKSGFVNKD